MIEEEAQPVDPGACVDAGEDSRQLLARLARFVPGVMYVFVREPDGRLHFPFVSEGVLRLYGVAARLVRANPELMLGRVHPQDRLELRRKMTTSMSCGTPWSARYRVILDDGVQRWHDGYSQPEIEPGGRVTWHGYIVDATERVAHDAIALQNEVLRRENEAKSRFMQRLSHELRTPLNAISGFSQLLLGGSLALDPAARRQLELVLAAGRHMTRLVEDLLGLPGSEILEYSLQIERVQVAEIISEAVGLVAPMAAESEVLVEHEPGPDAAAMVVRADPVRLRQVLLNLLTNAIKYNRRGGWVKLGVASSGDCGVVRVTDSGIGLAPDQLKHLFEPFNRLGAEASTVAGWGIGLVVSRRLLELMNGSIEVDSRDGQGCRFSVRLPLG
jgi:signal transduction histidine kinase